MRARLNSQDDQFIYSLNNDRIDQFCFLTQNPRELEKLKEKDFDLQHNKHQTLSMYVMPEMYPKDKVTLLANNRYHPNYFDILNIALNLAIEDEHIYYYHNVIRKISDPYHKENEDFY